MKVVMKNFWTWRKVILFLIIIGFGIMGLIFADQQDFLHGRKDEITSIGDGIADPLVTGTATTGQKASVPNPAKASGVDGIRKIPCNKKVC